MLKKILLPTLISIVILILMGFVFLINIALVHDVSMEPTLKEGQIVFSTNIKNWPIFKNQIYFIVLPNNSILIKRIIATPGENVEIKNNWIYINNKPSWKTDFPDIPKTKIKENYYYCYGDNQAESLDSKFIGLIPQNYIKSQILFATPVFSNK